MGIATDICPFFFFFAFTAAAESVAVAADVVAAELSFAFLSELSVPLQAIMPKMTDMIRLPCMNLLIVLRFILAFRFTIERIVQKPGPQGRLKDWKSGSLEVLVVRS